MVAVRNKKTGKVIGHQPPYTKEGEFRLYTAMSGGKEPTGIGIFIPLRPASISEQNSADGWQNTTGR